MQFGPRHDSVKSVRSKNLEVSNTLSRLDFKGLFDILILQFYSLMDHFGLEDRREVFRSVHWFPLQ